MSIVNKKIISLAVYVVLLLALVVGIVIFVVGAIKNPLTEGSDVGDDTAPEGEIIISEEIGLYREQEMHLAPYIVNKDGTVASSAFMFDVDREGVVTVEEGGIVKAVGEGEAIITITDRRSSLKKDVKVTVSPDLVAVLGVQAGTAGKLGSIGTQEYTYGQEYTLTVNTLPSGCDVSKLCKVTVNGDKEAFEVVYDKNEIKIIPIAIGYGILDVTVDGYYEGSLEFNLNFKNKSISDSIKKTHGTELMTKAEFDKVEYLTVEESLSNTDELGMFKNLEKLYVGSDSVISVKEISSNIKYYVPENLYRSYYTSPYWSDRLDRLVPYKSTDTTVRYIIYHNTKTNDISYKAIDSNFNELLELSDYDGQRFNGWRDKNGSNITLSSVKASTESIHVYSKWSDITYNVVYHIREFSQNDVTEKWTYGYPNTLKDIASFKNYKEPVGRVFIGWTTSDTSDRVVYKPNETVQNLASKQDETVDLYDVWKTVTYEVSFVIPNTLPFTIEVPDTITVEYDKDFTLPPITINDPGYLFKGWKDQNGKIYSSGTNKIHLTKKDGDKITLTADIEAIISTYLFVLDGGILVNENGQTEREDFVLEIGYGASYKLLAPTHPEGKTFKGWKCENVIYQAGDVITNDSPVKKTHFVTAIWE